MIDWDPDYEEYLEANCDFDPYEEEYTGKPIEESYTRVGEAHHPDCPYKEHDPQWDCCKALWLADFELKAEQEAEELHQEWWQ